MKPLFGLEYERDGGVLKGHQGSIYGRSSKPDGQRTTLTDPIGMGRDQGATQEAIRRGSSIARPDNRKTCIRRRVPRHVGFTNALMPSGIFGSLSANNLSRKDQYKKKISKWRFQRKVTAREKSHMIRIRHQRRRGNQSKKTQFRVRQQPVDNALLDRYQRDNPRRKGAKSCKGWSDLA